LNKKKIVIIKKVNPSVIDQNINVKITRGMKNKLLIEEIKRKEQILLNKFPSCKLKMITIQLNDCSKQAKFLSNLGLECHYKCLFSKKKIKRNS